MKILLSTHRKCGNAKSNRQKQRTLSDYWLGTPKTANQFDILADEYDNENYDVSSKTTPILKPPPIYISMVKNVQPLLNLLNEIAPNEFEIKIIKNEEVKIQPKTEEKYSFITKALLEKKTEFHTFKLKSERPFNIVL